MRHKDVRHCSIGAMAFLLALRFEITQEFDHFQAQDWIDNSKWFDIKLLVDATRSNTNFTLPLKNDTYSKAMKAVLEHLKIPSSHWVHLGRVVGPKILEMQEEDAEEIRRLGNWNPTIQETSYSNKLPLQPMRKMAGFNTAMGMYFNPRTTVMPSEELLALTPFSFAFSACDEVEEAVKDVGGSYTALSFLRFLKELAIVFLQDSAAMMALHPERKVHPVFSLNVFQSNTFEVRM